MNSLGERKLRHLKISLHENVDADIGTGFNEVRLVHRCLPEIDLDDVSTKTMLFGKEIEAPLIIGAITGGTTEAGRINEILATVAEEKGIGIGVGSQRIAVENPDTAYTFSVVRDNAPKTLVIGNLGCPQLSLGWGVDEARTCVEMVKADALSLHMNPLQESVQVKGDTRYAGILEKVREVSTMLKTPIIMKETGAGVAFEDAVKLEKAGVAGIDVSGVGGTSWSAVEYHIAKEVGEKFQEYLGEALWNWGIPTAVSVVEVSYMTDLTVIASGGIRTGLEIAKSIALGAEAASMANPFLKRAVKGFEELSEFVDQLIKELKVVMFLTGSKNINELHSKPVLIFGRTAEWLKLRGINPHDFTQRNR